MNTMHATCAHYSWIRCMQPPLPGCPEEHSLVGIQDTHRMLPMRQRASCVRGMRQRASLFFEGLLFEDTSLFPLRSYQDKVGFKGHVGYFGYVGDIGLFSGDIILCYVPSYRHKWAYSSIRCIPPPTPACQCGRFRIWIKAYSCIAHVLIKTSTPYAQLDRFSQTKTQRNTWTYQCMMHTDDWCIPQPIPVRRVIRNTSCRSCQSCHSCHSKHSNDRNAMNMSMHQNARVIRNTQMTRKW